MRFLVGMMLIVSVVGSPRGAVAGEEEDSAEAKRLYKRGMARFHLNEYDQAIEEFAGAYRVKPDPVFLYNIAQAHRLANRPEQALEYYEKYLRAAEDAPNRAEVETRIRDLKKLIQDTGRVLGGTPTATMAPAKGPVKDKEPALAAVKEEPVKGEAVPAAALQPDAPAASPVYKRWWFWTVAAVVVVGAGAGIGAGVATSGGSSEHGLPSVHAQ